MNSGKLKAVLIVSLVFNLAVVGAFAYRWTRTPRSSFRGIRTGEEHEEFLRTRSRHLARRLQLPPEKAEHLEQILIESGRQAEETRKRLFEARRELFTILEQEEADRDEIMAKVEEISKLQGELEKHHIQVYLDTRSVLDPEEQERFRRLIRRGMKHWLHGRSHHRRHNGTRKEGRMP
jgi:Spy/CpxP family protein refolding chaperone